MGSIKGGARFLDERAGKQGVANGKKVRGGICRHTFGFHHNRSQNAILGGCSGSIIVELVALVFPRVVHLQRRKITDRGYSQGSACHYEKGGKHPYDHEFAVEHTETS